MPTGQVLVSEGRAVGLKLRDGRVENGDVVVVNADTPYAYQKLLEHTPSQAEAPSVAETSEDLDGREYSCGVIAFFWAVDCKVDYLRHHTIFLGTPVEEKKAWEPITEAAQMPERPNFYVHCPTRTDPSAAPEGCETWPFLKRESIMVLFPVANMQQMAEAGFTPGKKGELYRGLREQARKTVLKRFKEAGCGDLEKHIVEETVRDPELIGELYNLQHGATFGLSHGLLPWQGGLAMTRPPPRAAEVDGLYFVGAGTRPGNGVPLVLMGAGLTSQLILDDVKAKVKERLAFEYKSNWEAKLQEVLAALVTPLAGPIDVVYPGLLGPEQFPLQIELPNPGTQKPSLQLKLEFSLAHVGGQQSDARGQSEECSESMERSFLPKMGSRGKRGSIRRSQSLQSMVNNVGRVLRVYVQATCNGQVQKTAVEEVEQGCKISFFEEAGLFFQVFPADLGGRKATELLSAVRIAVYDKRSSWIRGDALVGEGWLYLPQEVPNGEPRTQELVLQRRGEKVETKVNVTFTLLSLEDARARMPKWKRMLRLLYLLLPLSCFHGATVAQNAKHSFLAITRALAQLVQVPGGVSLLLKACPKAQDLIHRRAERAWRTVARRLLDFVERHAVEPDADIPKLIVDWMLHLSAQAPIRGAIRGTSIREAIANEGRLKKFLSSAQLELKNLVPMDAEGLVDSAWKKEAMALKEIGNWHYGLMHVPEGAVLGRGSYGTVWRARDAHTGQIYATAQRESDVVDRLVKEPHRCVVQLFHAMHFPDLRMYCFVMELCSKGSLTEHIRQLRWSNESLYVPPLEAFPWIGQVLLGMEHLHGLGMLVRDLKTDNVVLSDEGRSGLAATAPSVVAKLTDFGLCRFGTEANGDWTFGAPPGTPAYIAPEVIKGQSYGKAADLYSFGAVIWVILSGGLKVSGRPKVEPPCAAMAHKWDYSALAQNHALIAACVSSPSEHHTQSLPSKEAEAPHA
eukprot:g6716.t1